MAEKNTVAAVFKLGYTAIGYISSVFAFSVLLKDLIGFTTAENLCKRYWMILILIGTITSFVKNHEKVSYKSKVKDDDLQVEVEVNDLFSIKASSYVIPTNTYFRTIMEAE